VLGVGGGAGAGAGGGGGGSPEGAGEEEATFRNENPDPVGGVPPQPRGPARLLLGGPAAAAGVRLRAPGVPPLAPARPPPVHHTRPRSSPCSSHRRGRTTATPPPLLRPLPRARYGSMGAGAHRGRTRGRGPAPRAAPLQGTRCARGPSRGSSGCAWRRGPPGASTSSTTGPCTPSCIWTSRAPTSLWTLSSAPRCPTLGSPGCTREHAEGPASSAGSGAGFNPGVVAGLGVPYSGHAGGVGHSGCRPRGVVNGTPGYVDPACERSSQLTEKLRRVRYAYCKVLYCTLQTLPLSSCTALCCKSPHCTELQCTNGTASLCTVLYCTALS